MSPEIHDVSLGRGVTGLVGIHAENQGCCAPNVGTQGFRGPNVGIQEFHDPNVGTQGFHDPGVEIQGCWDGRLQDGATCYNREYVRKIMMEFVVRMLFFHIPWGRSRVRKADARVGTNSRGEGWTHCRSCVVQGAREEENRRKKQMVRRQLRRSYNG